MSTVNEVDVVIIGAGLGGLYQLHALRSQGLTVRVIEAASGVGGTWFHNKYPGARCDIQSIMYSYSFSPELDQEWTWVDKFASQPELLRYINHVADKFDLRKDITFDTRVTSAVYDERDHKWEIHTDRTELEHKTIRCQFLIAATGVLSAPKLPEVPHIEKFKGDWFHTSQWPDREPRFTGRRVAVIGTGSSAVQSIPLIAKQAAQVTIFQRTPCFAMPACNRPLTASEVKETKAHYPAKRVEQRASRGGVFDVPESTTSALAASDADRQAKYEAIWNEGTLFGFYGAYADIMIDKEANDTAASFIRHKIDTIVKDPETAKALHPSYAFGSKRPCLNTNYFETFNEEHVHLVDLNKTPIVEITETGILTTEKNHEFDVIVYATGFDAFTGALTRIDVRGRNGVSLKTKWKTEGTRTYLGIAIAGFPNLFTVQGPFSTTVFATLTLGIELHADWIAGCIGFLREHGIEEIEAKEDAQREWVAHATTVANFTLFPSGPAFYSGCNVLGKERLFLGYIGGLGSYRLKCDEVAAKGYEGFTLSTSAPHSKP